MDEFDTDSSNSDDEWDDIDLDLLVEGMGMSEIDEEEEDSNDESPWEDVPLSTPRFEFDTIDKECFRTHPQLVPLILQRVASQLGVTDLRNINIGKLCKLFLRGYVLDTFRHTVNQHLGKHV